MSRILREAMTESLTKMLKPSRMILNLKLEELAKFSGLSRDFIASVEAGERYFETSNYLQVAAVLDNASLSVDKNIYEAVIRLLTPEKISTEKNIISGDFVLVRRWLETFNNEDDNEEEYNEPVKIESEFETGFFSDSDIERLVQKYKIFADTSAVEDDYFPELMGKLDPFLRENDAALIIPKSLMNDLSDDYLAAEDEEEEVSAKNLISYVEQCKSEGLIVVRGNDTGVDTDEALQEIFENLQDEYRFALITQDSEKAKLTLDNTINRKSPVVVLYFDEEGNLFVWDFSEEENF